VAAPSAEASSFRCHVKAALTISLAGPSKRQFAVQLAPDLDRVRCVWLSFDGCHVGAHLPAVAGTLPFRPREFVPTRGDSRIQRTGITCDVLQSAALGSDT
jgi:hypothetical protein